jgi:RNA polymerase sigma-70 factor (ECF subfamily)
VTALQLLPPRQRAVLILRDVLGFRAREVAGMLESTEESVTSALKRARAAMGSRLGPAGQREPPPSPGSPAEQHLVARLTQAFERGAIDDMVALLTEDVLLSMPPLPLEYQGRELARQFFTAVWRNRSYRLVPTRANGQPAFAVYVRDPHAGVAHANGLLVASLAGPRICALTRFDNSVLPGFGLPRTLPD